MEKWFLLSFTGFAFFACKETSSDPFRENLSSVEAPKPQNPDRETTLSSLQVSEKKDFLQIEIPSSAEQHSDILQNLMASAKGEENRALSLTQDRKVMEFKAISYSSISKDYKKIKIDLGALLEPQFYGLEIAWKTAIDQVKDSRLLIHHGDFEESHCIRSLPSHRKWNPVATVFVEEGAFIEFSIDSQLTSTLVDSIKVVPLNESLFYPMDRAIDISSCDQEVVTLDASVIEEPFAHARLESVHHLSQAQSKIFLQPKFLKRGFYAVKLHFAAGEPKKFAVTLAHVGGEMKKTFLSPPTSRSPFAHEDIGVFEFYEGQGGHLLLEALEPGIKIDYAEFMFKGETIHHQKLPVIHDIKSQALEVQGGFSEIAQSEGSYLLWEPSQNEAQLKITPKLSGHYEVFVSWPALEDNASNTKISFDLESHQLSLRIAQSFPLDELGMSLGSYDFSESDQVSISTEGADGNVVFEAIRFVPQD